MNTDIHYSALLQEAIRNVWSHKKLWVLGMMAAFFTGQSNVNVNYETRQPIDVTPAQLSQPMIALFLGENWQQLIPLFVGLGALAIAWMIVAFVLGTWVQGAQIEAVVDVVLDKEVTIKTVFGRSWRRINLLVGIGLVVFAPGLVMLALITVTLAPLLATFLRPMQELSQLENDAMFSMIAPFLCLAPLLLCIGLPLMVILGMLQVFAQRACMIEYLGVMAAYRRAVGLIRRHLGHTLLTLIILFAFGALLAGSMALPAMIFWLPVAQAMQNGVWTAGTVISALVFAPFWLGINVGLGGLLSAFGSTLWTRLYVTFVLNEEPPTDSPPANLLPSSSPPTL